MEIRHTEYDLTQDLNRVCYDDSQFINNEELLGNLEVISVLGIEVLELTKIIFPQRIQHFCNPKHVC